MLICSLFGHAINAYRARRLRASPLWQCLHACYARFLDDYALRYESAAGPLRPIVCTAFGASLRCGDLSKGFTRIRCDRCGHGYLLPFTCKQRAVCPSCHQRRTLDRAATLSQEVYLAVPHRHVVLTVPRALRWAFRHDRSRLPILFACGVEALTCWLRLRTGVAEGEIAAIAAIQTFGDYLVFHPHLHLLVAAGVFDHDGRFHLVPPGGVAELAELFRHIVLRRLVNAGIIASHQARRFLAWRHSGFNVDTGQAPVGAVDREGRRRLAEYLLRAPFALEKMEWNAATKSMLYRSERNWRTKRNFELFSGPDFLAALAEHIPEKHAQTIRYFGRYSNRRRGRLAREGRTPGDDPASQSSPLTPADQHTRRPRRHAWRELIVRIWGVDPLRCPRCHGKMRQMAVIDDLVVAERILRHLRLWEGATAIPPAQAPPVQPRPGVWCVDGHDGRLVEMEPVTDRRWMPARCPVPPARERYLDYAVSAERAGGGDELGREQPRRLLDRDDGTFILFDLDAGSAPPEDEPIFWA